MKIRVICVGKLKERFFAEAAAEYCKRLSAYARVEIAEVADEPCPENASEAEKRRVLEREGERILAKLPEKGTEHACVFALAIDGPMFDSVALSGEFSALALSGVSSFVFVIGGSLGLSPAVLAAADRKLSFSKLTFPHQLMRVILLEQLYRCLKISRGEPYHK